MDWLLTTPPSLIIGIIVGGAAILMLLVLVTYNFFVRSQNKRPQSVWENIMRERLIFAAILWIGWAGLTAILLILIQPLIRNVLDIFSSILVVMYIIGLIVFLGSRIKNTGSMILYVIPFPYRRITRVLGIIVIVMGCASLIFLLPPISKEYFWNNFSFDLFCIAQGIYFIILSYSHLRIHEKGIQAYLDFIPWNKIESYSWISDTHATALKYRFQGKRLWFMRNGAILVPARKKKQIEAILAEYFPEAGLPPAS